MQWESMRFAFARAAGVDVDTRDRELVEALRKALTKREC